ncbi:MULTISPECIES: hypothetical protein [Streptomyces]|uniref:Uncharacterized protein n=1 Tax=Streptomyces niveus TaxID=193462 RepID=A0ABZ2A6J1_STRNV|nr:MULTISPECIES: hypothetical protein [Streptomyces]EST29064.1 hypothetical protein M877_12790 [Streptomyces niveus NCIMB 11891]TFI28472.1 hypothetical protein E4P36_09160 [Streptomyces sp. 4R-3d]WTA61660.1 hypothetical protein OG211_25845 [Streptomyces niveus]
MISITSKFVSTAKMTDRSVVSACSLDVLRPGLLATEGTSFIATALSGASAGRINPVTLPVTGGNERPSKALAAEVAAAEAQAYAFAAAGAESKKQTKQTKQHHTMWAIRGPEPWRDPA